MAKKKTKKSKSQQGKASKLKGDRGERELAKTLKMVFPTGATTARRTNQYCGNTGDASDVMIEDFPQLHWEVKRCESLSLYSAVDQAIHDAALKGKLPTVCHRRNFKQWLFICNLEDLPKIAEILVRMNDAANTESQSTQQCTEQVDSGNTSQITQGNHDGCTTGVQGG